MFNAFVILLLVLLQDFPLDSLIGINLKLCHFSLRSSFQRMRALAV